MNVASVSETSLAFLRSRRGDAGIEPAPETWMMLRHGISEEAGAVEVGMDRKITSVDGPALVEVFEDDAGVLESGVAVHQGRQLPAQVRATSR